MESPPLSSEEEGPSPRSRRLFATLLNRPDLLPHYAKTPQPLDIPRSKERAKKEDVRKRRKRVFALLPFPTPAPRTPGDLRPIHPEYPPQAQFAGETPFTPRSVPEGFAFPGKKLFPAPGVHHSEFQQPGCSYTKPVPDSTESWAYTRLDNMGHQQRTPALVEIGPGRKIMVSIVGTALGGKDSTFDNRSWATSAGRAILDCTDGLADLQQAMWELRQAGFKHADLDSEQAILRNITHRNGRLCVIDFGKIDWTVDYDSDEFARTVWGTLTAYAKKLKGRLVGKETLTDYAGGVNGRLAGSPNWLGTTCAWAQSRKKKHAAVFGSSPTTSQNPDRGTMPSDCSEAPLAATGAFAVLPSEIVQTEIGRNNFSAKTCQICRLVCKAWCNIFTPLLSEKRVVQQQKKEQNAVHSRRVFFCRRSNVAEQQWEQALADLEQRETLPSGTLEFTPDFCNVKCEACGSTVVARPKGSLRDIVRHCKTVKHQSSCIFDCSDVRVTEFDAADDVLFYSTGDPITPPLRKKKKKKTKLLGAALVDNEQIQSNGACATQADLFFSTGQSELSISPDDSDDVGTPRRSESEGGIVPEACEEEGTWFKSQYSFSSPAVDGPCFTGLGLKEWPFLLNAPTFEAHRLQVANAVIPSSPLAMDVAVPMEILPASDSEGSSCDYCKNWATGIDCTCEERDSWSASPESMSATQPCSGCDDCEKGVPDVEERDSQNISPESMSPAHHYELGTTHESPRIAPPDMEEDIAPPVAAANPPKTGRQRVRRKRELSSSGEEEEEEEESYMTYSQVDLVLVADGEGEHDSDNDSDYSG